MLDYVVLWGQRSHVYSQTDRKQPLPALQLLTQKHKSRPTGSRLHLTARTSPCIFYQFWHNHSSSKHDSPLYTKLYDSSDPMPFPFTWVNIQRPLSMSVYGSRIERQTRSRFSLPPSSAWRGRKAKTEEGNGQQVLARASHFLLHRSADWRQRGRLGGSPVACQALITCHLRDVKRAGLTGKTTRSQSWGTSSSLHPLYSAQLVLHEKRPHPQGIRSQHHFTTCLMPLTEAGRACDWNHMFY